MRIALGVEYNGTTFHGWQSQKNLATVQQTIEKALSLVADESITIVCAGRTDAGVHATHQVIHFNTNAVRKLEAWVLGANSRLPATIRIQWVKPVDESFHARFSALSRRYQYYIYNKPIKSSFLATLTTFVSKPLDTHAMHNAAQSLLGEHDFSSFRSIECQSRTAKRHIFAIEVLRRNDLVIIDITANSFLHHMVRNITGVLIDIGTGRKITSWCRELLALQNRSLASRTAPPHGLYLAGVYYSDVYELPCRFVNPFFLTE